MNGRFLLDTNAVIALLKAEPTIQELIAGIEETFVSIIVLGELYYGAQKSERVQRNLSKIEGFAATCTVLGCDVETARQYGLIKQALQKRGKPIPENDLWIAATARQHKLTLMSRDGHFKEIEGLKVIRWERS